MFNDVKTLHSSIKISKFFISNNLIVEFLGISYLTGILTG